MTLTDLSLELIA
jgi:GTPase SAR1 family protein